MKAADALDSNDTALADHTPRMRNGSPICLCRIHLRRIHRQGVCLVRMQEVDSRTAVVAADRLRIIAPAFCMRVFVLTGGAHRKGLHAGAFPVIGHPVKDGNSGAARGAVDKGMQITPVVLVEQFLLASVTDSDIR